MLLKFHLVDIFNTPALFPELSTLQALTSNNFESAYKAPLQLG
jgi:hypothetical protein